MHIRNVQANGNVRSIAQGDGCICKSLSMDDGCVSFCARAVKDKSPAVVGDCGLRWCGLELHLCSNDGCARRVEGCAFAALPLQRYRQARCDDEEYTNRTIHEKRIAASEEGKQ